jgi:hypothetical protein
MISSKQALLLLVLSATLVCVASAREAQIFHESDLESLVDQPIPDGAELVGDFAYLGEPREGFHTFASFQATPSGVKFGNLLIIVRFPDGFPSNIKLGKVIRPDAEHPLTLELVKRSPNGLFIIVRATFREIK